MTGKLSVKTIFWDYDGCIHDSLKIYAPAFRQAQAFLVNSGLANPERGSEVYTDQEIKKWIGFSPQQMWLNFRPDLPLSVRAQASELIGTHMQNAIIRGEADWYPGAREVLQQLKSAGITMILISHCKVTYIEAHRKIFDLDRYFERIIATESYNYISKSAILATIKDQYPFPQVMIGDRKSDIEAGHENQLISIGCEYGFADRDELNAADFIIESIGETINILKAMASLG